MDLFPCIFSNMWVSNPSKSALSLQVGKHHFGVASFPQLMLLPLGCPVSRNLSTLLPHTHLKSHLHFSKTASFSSYSMSLSVF